MLYNIKLLTKDWASMLWFLVVASIIIRLGYAFIDIPTVVGNQWKIVFIVESISHILLSCLIGVFVAIHIYRYRKLKIARWKQSAWWAIGSFLGILVTGCPGCSFTIAGMIGLAGVFSALPFAGLEVKILWLLIMLWVVYKSIIDLLVCKIK